MCCVCTRQVRDFLQRVKCGRFPPIEKDMRMVAAHCGSLFLDPTALTQVQSFVVGRDFIEKLQLLHLIFPELHLPHRHSVPLSRHPIPPSASRL